MKINEILKDEKFLIREGIVNKLPVYLITPKKGVYDMWTSNNLWARSLMVDKETLEIVSRGFDKFFNWNEREDIQSNPGFDNFEGVEYRQKIDGSLCIISVINGEINIRTRGCFDATVQYPATAKEYADFRIRYKAMFDWLLTVSKSSSVSILCEHTSPNNVIVLNYGQEPELRLLNIISNKTGLFVYPQDVLDIKARNDWNIARPIYYKVNSREDVDKILQIKDIEGFVVYFENGQKMKKLKTEEYLQRHAIRSTFNHNTLLKEFFNTERTIASAYNLKDYMLRNYEYELIDNTSLWNWWNSIVKQCDVKITLISQILNSVDFSKVTKKEFAEKVFKTWPNDSINRNLAFLWLKCQNTKIDFNSAAINSIIKIIFEQNKENL